MHTTLLRLTPEAASGFLKNNKANRPVSNSTVAAYAADMASGNWRLTHQGLLVGKNGILIDGQHRCHAVVKSGVSVDILLSFDDTLTGPLNVPIDIGWVRPADLILGVAKRQVAVAAYIARRVTGTTKLSPAALQPYLDWIAEEIATLPAACKRHISQAPVQAAAVAWMKLRRGEAGYVRSAYSAMLRDDFDFMAQAPVIGSFYKQMNAGGQDSLQLFSLAMRAFDPDSRGKQKLTIRDPATANADAVARLRSLWDRR